MATTAMTAKYRPVRVGFLVRQGHIEDLARAAQINTLLWGGLFNPIIPVATGTQPSLTEPLMKLFAPDALFHIADAPELKAFAGRYPMLRDPAHLAERIFYEDWRTKRNNVAYLDVINVILELWHYEFRHKDESFQSNCALVKWDAADPLADLLTVMFGQYSTTDNLRADFAGTFLEGLRAREVEITRDTQISSDLAALVTPLRLTRHDIRQYGGGWRDAGGVFIGRHDSFDDLLAFWNLRAAGEHLVFYPVEPSDRLRALATAFIQRLDELPNSHPTFEDWIVFRFSQNEEEAKSIVDTFQTKKRKLFARVSDIIWNGLNVQPTSKCFDWQRAVGSVEREFRRYQVSLSFPEKKFLKQAEADRIEVGQQLLAISLEPHSDFGFPGHTLRVPYLPDLNEFYSREIAFDPWKLRVEKEGFALLIHVSEEGRTLFPLPNDQLIDRLFEFAGIKSQLSQPGRLATRLIGSLREHDPLEACRVFKIRGVRKLLKTLRAGDLMKWPDALRIIYDKGSFKRFEGLYIESRKSRKLTPRDAFNFLIKKRILRPRLRWWERMLSKRRVIDCGHCGLKDDVRLTVFEADRWTCPYCSARQDLAPRLIRLFRDTPKPWNFERRGLFAKNNNQEGALPVVLTLLTFNRVLDFSNVIYSTGRELTVDSRHCEIDFVILSYKRGPDEMEITIGEAKDEAGEIDDRDLENLAMIADRLRKAGFSCHITISKAADKFSERETERFSSVNKMKYPLILLTNRELEPYYPYWDEDDKDALPHKYALGMNEMAGNAEFRYVKSRSNEAKR